MKLVRKLILLSRALSSAPAAFSPLDIAGLTAWHDKSDITKLWQDSARTVAVAADGDPLGAVDDKSGNGYHVTQATTGNKPTYKTAIRNGLSVASFDGGDKLASAAFPVALTQPVTLFIVLKDDDVDTTNRQALSGLTDPARHVLYRETTWRLYAGAVLDSGDTNDANWHYFTVIVNGASSKIRMDGVEIASGDGGAFTLDGLIIGDGTGTEYWDGYISETLVYDALLTAGEYGQVETFLATKWGF